MPTNSNYSDDESYSDETSRLAQVREIASDKLEQARVVAGQKLDEARIFASQKLDEARTFAGDKLDIAKEKAGTLLATCEKFARERPGTAVLISLGVGWLAGKLVKT